MTVVQRRIRKYFSEKDGKDLMDEPHQTDELMQTITMKKPFYKQPLPVNTYSYEIRYYQLGGFHDHKHGKHGKKAKYGEEEHTEITKYGSHADHEYTQAELEDRR